MCYSTGPWLNEKICLCFNLFHSTYLLPSVFITWLASCQACAEVRDVIVTTYRGVLHGITVALRVTWRRKTNVIWPTIRKYSHCILNCVNSHTGKVASICWNGFQGSTFIMLVWYVTGARAMAIGWLIQPFCDMPSVWLAVLLSSNQEARVKFSVILKGFIVDIP